MRESNLCPRNVAKHYSSSVDSELFLLSVDHRSVFRNIRINNPKQEKET